jgi:nicotinamide riboside transporter PnuC
MSSIEISGWIAFSLTCIGVVLTAKKKISCWIILIAANFFWTYNLWGNKVAVLMQGFLLVANIYGWISWEKGEKKTYSYII